MTAGGDPRRSQAAARGDRARRSPRARCRVRPRRRPGARERGPGRRRARRRRADHRARPPAAGRGRRGGRRQARAPRRCSPGSDPDVEVIDAGKAPHAQQPDPGADQRADRGAGRGRASGWYGSRAATRSCSAAAARRRWPASGPGVPVPGRAGRHQRGGGARPAPGIPVTHRGITQDFAVVSAHLDPSQPGATVDWEALAAGPGTLVLLMAVAHLAEVARRTDQAGPGRQHPGRGDLRRHHRAASRCWPRRSGRWRRTRRPRRQRRPRSSWSARSSGCGRRSGWRHRRGTALGAA